MLAVLHPRKPYRTTFLGLLCLVFMTTYVFLAHGSALSPALALRHADSPAADQLAIALESIQDYRGSEFVPLSSHKHSDTLPNYRGQGRHRPKYPRLQLTQEEELAAISSFIASLPQNVIPPTVDPSQPIDPSLVLDFDTRGPRAVEEVRAMVEDVWTRNPVFVYSKLYSPAARELKNILSDLYIFPSPTIVDVDVRDDVDVLKPILARLTSNSELPVLLIGGRQVGIVDEIRTLAKEGRLQTLINNSGAVVNGAKKKQKKK
ncbi:hypothetical protein FA15DRAFT_590972 [Coprinopsis marcescibilis]|uniref:Uncharacterized protein n=1 Tax=Coprinopsis marcescibilis TaxID=230819 RepID=A0A5C3LAC0_COPMA|nr:hypothetical protein FA15DRAFT_590972 [Coprinopsis marcescibilis]